MRKLFLVLAAFGLGGCATVNRMAVDGDTAAVDTSSKSIVLMTIDVSRPDDSRFVPTPAVVKLERPNAQSKADRQNFTFNKNQDTVAEAGHTVYLARMALEPGPYRLGDVSGSTMAFPIVGQFTVPLLLDLNVKPNSITYIGRVSAQLRPRQDGEFRAGPVVPLIDQSVSGMSSGTWDVSVQDLSQRDLTTFRATYPALARTPIEVAPLPPFNRAAVQRWWDGLQSGDTAQALALPPGAVPVASSTNPPPAAPLQQPASPPVVAAVAALQPGSAKAGQSLPFLKQPRNQGDVSRIIPAGGALELQVRQVNPEGAWWFAQYEGGRGWVREQGLTQ